MRSSDSNVHSLILIGLLIVCVSQYAFGQLTQDAIAGRETTCWFLRRYGYDCESHKTTTSDGYILNMFRVLCPNANVTETLSPPVAFLMHGLLCSSSLWTISPETGLAMTLCDSGYDVWLGNARGNQYSKKHVTLSPLSPDFYKFSWSEIAAIDLPTMLNYTLRYTRQNKLHYVGHSQGTTVFFALASTNHKLAESLISSAHLLSPVVFTQKWQGVIMNLATVIFGIPDPMSNVIEIELLPRLVLSYLLGRALCADSDPTQGLCEDGLDILFGKSDLTNMIHGITLNYKTPKYIKVRFLKKLNHHLFLVQFQTVLPDLLRTYPAGSSLRQLKHYIQEKRSGNFAFYDFGALLNLQKYGSIQPPQYPLEKVNVPTFLYHAGNDYLSVVGDVERLIANLNPNTLKAVRYFPDYNHFDFIYANNVKENLHMLVLEDMHSV